MTDTSEHFVKTPSQEHPHRRRRRIAVAVLALFLGGLASATAEEVLSAHHDLARSGARSDGPESDSGSDGEPCAPDCACFCCPGHGARIVFATVPPALAVLPVGHLALSSPRDLHPAERAQRIFHPPRA